MVRARGTLRSKEGGIPEPVEFAGNIAPRSSGRIASAGALQAHRRRKLAHHRGTISSARVPRTGLFAPVGCHNTRAPSRVDFRDARVPDRDRCIRLRRSFRRGFRQFPATRAFAARGSSDRDGRQCFSSLQQRCRRFFSKPRGREITSSGYWRRSRSQRLGIAEIAIDARDKIESVLQTRTFHPRREIVSCVAEVAVAKK